MTRLLKLPAAIVLTCLSFTAQSYAQSSPNRCNGGDGVIVHASNQIAGGSFQAANATIGTIKMIGCKANRENCDRIVQMRTDVINKQGDGWVERAEAYLNLWTAVDCKPAS